MPNRFLQHRFLSGALAGLWLIALLTGWVVQPSLGLRVAAAAPAVISAEQPAFAHYSGTLAPGENVAPAYQQHGSLNRQINLKIVVAASLPDAALTLTITDAAAHQVFSSAAGSGQTLWTTATLLPGVNTFAINNPSTGAATLGYDLWLYDVAQVPSTVAGTSRGISSSWASQLAVQFPVDGLYTLACEKSAGRYQLLIDNDYIRKTIEASGSSVYFVAAGMHTLTVQPDGKQPETTWSLNLTGPGAAVDSLPFSKNGGHLGGVGNAFAEEWLPIRLGAAAPVNLALTLTGGSTDTLQAYLYTPDSTSPFTHTQVFGGETVWWTLDLPAGVSRLQLKANPANTAGLDYALTIAQPAGVSTEVRGAARGAGGAHSHLRFQVTDAGLYDFNYGLAMGRYQFLVDGDQYLQKTVEAPGTVRYYLNSGSHDLTIAQDPRPELTGWSIVVVPAGQAADTLPFTRVGGNLGGTANPYVGEWLPIYVLKGEGTNFRLQVTGDAGNVLRIAIWRSGDSTASYLSAPIHGGETFWWTSALGDGLNRIQVLADAKNATALQYAVTGQSIGLTPQTWQGSSLAMGANASVQVGAAAGGTYHIGLNTPQGFARVRLDGAALTAQAAPGLFAAAGHTTDFDVPLTAGLHQLTIQQVPDYPLTEWALTIAQSDVPGPLAHFTGSLAAGEQVTPVLPLPESGAKSLNFRLAVQGASGTLDLAITSGQGVNAYSGTALAGDIAWAPITLDSGSNVFSLKNSGASPLTYDLTVLEPSSTPFDWAGISQPGSAWKSAVTMAFPADGLYKFDFGSAGGRYQVILGANQIASLVESDSSQVFYVPAGQQILTVVADPVAKTATNWSVHASPAGANADSLPYHKNGGHLWGNNGTFHEEWLPIRLTTSTETNFQFKLQGASSDGVDISFVKDDTSTTVPGPRVYGGETVWRHVELPAGTTRVHLVAVSSNTGPLAYDLQAEAVPASPVTWSGTSNAAGNYSKLLFTAPGGGLYKFKYGIGAGRYQFVVDGNPMASVIKTVENPGEVTYFLAGGTHELTIVQDSKPATTAWSLEITATGEATDTLPLDKSGGNLGGQGNDFHTERLPVFASSAGPANFRLVANGNRGDLLRATLYGPSAATPVAQSGARGGEIMWWTAELVQGLNWIDLVAEGTNNAPLRYQLTILSVPSIRQSAPVSWSGVAAKEGNNSQIQVQTLVGGTYHVLADIPTGFANVYINPVPGMTLRAQATVLEFDVPLDAGVQQFQIQQSTQSLTTTWAVTVTLKDALAPKMTSHLPITVMNDVARTITIEGENFQPEATVQAGKLILGPVNWLDVNHLTVQIPARQPVGSYDLTVINPDGKSASAPGGLQVIQGEPLRIFFPVMTRHGR